MAGSFPHSHRDDDAILVARLDGLKLLADQLSEPVVIFDPTLKLVYANSRGEAVVSKCPLLRSATSLSGDPASIPQESCSVCPAKEILEQSPSSDSGHTVSVKSMPTLQHDDPQCPFPASFPLPDIEGAVACVVMMGQAPEDSIVWRKQLDSTNLVHDASRNERKREPRLLIGQSALMQQLVEMIGLVAKSESTVLIEGESGTGKELVAKTVHELSSRRDHPFVVVECSSLPETLLESELFGHVKGAFTGAVADRKGLFEEAEGGTIFLDEIGDTPPTFQAKLLRVLQEGEVKPVGSNRSVQVDVRVISASNKALTELISTKAFRSDLYYRLAVLPLMVPALRDRREDMPLLVSHFLDQSCIKNRKAGFSIPSETMQVLASHDWPGNVRELENVIERAVVIAEGPILDIQDIWGTTDNLDKTMDLPSLSKAARQLVEKQEILKALQETQGDKTRAARRLNISRANLYNKLKTYQIQ